MAEYMERWSSKARSDFEGIIESILDRWPPKIALNFIEDIDNARDVLKTKPYRFPPTESSPDMRKYPVNEHVSLYYRINGPIVEIIRLYINRNDPDNRRL